MKKKHPSCITKCKAKHVCCCRFLIPQVSTAPLHSSNFSSRSAVETTSRARPKQSSVVHSSFHSSQVHSRTRRSKSLCQADQELLLAVPTETASFPLPLPPSGTLRRSLSGTLAQDRGYWQEEELPYQSAYKGPSHRTISRITNRQQHFQQQGSTFLQEGWGGTGRVLISAAGNGSGSQCRSRSNPAQYQAPLHRAASLHSLRSVGKGVDVMDGASIHSTDLLDG